MRFPIRFSVWLVAALSALVAGCAGSRAARAPQADTDAPPEENLIEAHAHYAAGVVQEEAGVPEMALPEFSAAALKDPGDEELVLEVSLRLLQARQPQSALDVLTRATARPAASAALFARLGFIYGQLGKTNLAISANRTAIRKNPRALPAYQNLYLIYLQAKQGGAALDVLEEAARAARVDAGFLVGLGELYLNFAAQIPAQRRAVQAKAAAVFQRAVQTGSPDLQLRLRMADGLFLLEKDDTAGPLYRALLEELPDVPLLRDRVREKLANLYLRGHDRKLAMPLLEEIVRDNPTDVQAYYLLGGLAFDEKQYATATEAYSKILLLQPNFEPAYYELASAQLGAEQPRAALATLDAARKKFRQSFLLEYLTATAYSREKDFTNALAGFTAAEVVAQARETNRLNEVFYFQFGAACERNGNYTEAEKYFEKCLNLAPNFVEALNYLGYMLAERGDRLERARALITQALRAEPQNAAYLDSMGWVLFKLGQPKAALTYLLQAIKSPEAEEDGTVYDHLGEVYAALGERDKARDAWRKSLKLEPSDAVQKKLEH